MELIPTFFYRDYFYNYKLKGFKVKKKLGGYVCIYNNKKIAYIHKSYDDSGIVWLDCGNDSNCYDPEYFNTKKTIVASVKYKILHNLI